MKKEIVMTIEHSGAAFNKNFISGEYLDYKKFFDNQEFSHLRDRYCPIDITKGNQFKLIKKTRHPIDASEWIYILESDYGIHLMSNFFEELHYTKDLLKYIMGKYGVGEC